MNSEGGQRLIRVLLKPLLVLLALVLLVLLQALALGLDLALGALLGQSGELTRETNNTPARRRGTTHIPYSHSPYPYFPCNPCIPIPTYSLSLFPVTVPCRCSLSIVTCAAVVPVTVALTVVTL